MSRTATYHATVTWKGEHRGWVALGNGPGMEFSAPPDAHGHAGVLTPEDAFVAAANSCVMLMFLWAAERIAEDVDLLLGSRGRSRESTLPAEPSLPGGAEPVVATCSCGSGIPIQSVLVGRETVSILALPLIFEQFRQAARVPDEPTGRDLLEKVRVYNSVPAGKEEAYTSALLREYAAFLSQKEGPR